MPFHGEHSPNPMAAALVSRVLPMFSQLNAALLRCTLASRCHHLIKAFWGWQDQQLPDGTLTWTSQSGQTYVTTPGSALLFPSLCVPTAALVPPDPSLCPATVCRPGGDDAQAATYPRPEPGLLHRRGTPTKSTGPATQRGGTIAGCRERRRAAALLGVRQAWMNAWASSQVGNRRRRGPRSRWVPRRRGRIAPAGRIETAIPNSGQGVNTTTDRASPAAASKAVW